MRNKSKAQLNAGLFLVGLFLVTVGLTSCSNDEPTEKKDQVVSVETIKAKALQLSPGYLKEIPGSSGVVEFKDNSKGVFAGHIKLNGLTKGSYLLTLNENNQFPIKHKLSGWKAWGSEQYLDFEQIYVDDRGSYEGSVEADLPPGKYTFKFFVKEVGGKYPSVLYNNFLKLKVK